MPVRNDREIVDVDLDAVIDLLRERVRGTLYTVSEYDRDEFNPLYVSDAAIATYPDEEAMYEHFDLIHDYVNVDFTEMDLFAGSLFPEADRVEYLVTRMDYLKIVRIYSDRQGVLLALDPEEPVEPLAEPFLEAMYDD